MEHSAAAHPHAPLRTHGAVAAHAMLALCGVEELRALVLASGALIRLIEFAGAAEEPMAVCGAHALHLCAQSEALLAVQEPCRGT